MKLAGRYVLGIAGEMKRPKGKKGMIQINTLCINAHNFQKSKRTLQPKASSI